MTGQLEGQVAFITGAARGQGRSHALRLAQLGADIVALDLCSQVETVPYDMSTPSDLDETAELVKALGREIVTRQADVRDPVAVSEAVSAGLATFGRLDIVIANAGVAPSMSQSDPHEIWRDVIDINLTGVWNTIQACKDALISGGRGGSIVIISSTIGLKGVNFNDVGTAAYSASKHALVGVMRGFARDLAKYGVRVNTVHPTGVNTPMVVSEVFAKFHAAVPEAFVSGNALPVELLEPSDISNTIEYLVTDLGRWVTGSTLAVDAGYLLN